MLGQKHGTVKGFVLPAAAAVSLLGVIAGLTASREAAGSPTSARAKELEISRQKRVLSSADALPFATDALRRLMAREAGPLQIFESESRAEPWASAMEKALSFRIAAASVQGVGQVQQHEVVCRKSSCRLSVLVGPAVTSAARTRSPKSRRTPFLDLVSKESGPLATASHAPSSSEGSESVILFFGKQEIDPSSYPLWVSESRKRQ